MHALLLNCSVKYIALRSALPFSVFFVMLWFWNFWLLFLSNYITTIGEFLGIVADKKLILLCLVPLIIFLSMLLFVVVWPSNYVFNLWPFKVHVLMTKYIWICLNWTSCIYFGKYIFTSTKREIIVFDFLV